MTEDQADREAEILFPLPDPLSPDYSIELYMEFYEKQRNYADEYYLIYRNRVADKWGLTIKQLHEIGLEGAISFWPMP
jgi:hypothetical protein